MQVSSPNQGRSLLNGRSDMKDGVEIEDYEDREDICP